MSPESLKETKKKIKEEIFTVELYVQRIGWLKENHYLKTRKQIREFYCTFFKVTPQNFTSTIRRDFAQIGIFNPTGRKIRPPKTPRDIYIHSWISSREKSLTGWTVEEVYKMIVKMDKINVKALDIKLKDMYRVCYRFFPWLRQRNHFMESRKRLERLRTLHSYAGVKKRPAFKKYYQDNGFKGESWRNQFNADIRSVNIKCADLVKS